MSNFSINSFPMDGINKKNLNLFTADASIHREKRVSLKGHIKVRRLFYNVVDEILSNVDEIQPCV